MSEDDNESVRDSDEESMPPPVKSVSVAAKSTSQKPPTKLSLKRQDSGTLLVNCSRDCVQYFDYIPFHPIAKLPKTSKKNPFENLT
jgi:hypothetical protein